MRKQILAASLVLSILSGVAHAGPLENARRMRTAGIVVTSIGIAATVPILIGGLLMAAHPDDNDGWAISGGMMIYSAAVAGPLLVTGIPLWAVGQSRARLSFGPNGDKRGLSGASANLAFRF